MSDWSAGFRVRCADEVVRHDEPFATLREAKWWAEWGHACTAEHDIEEVRSMRLPGEWKT